VPGLFFAVAGALLIVWLLPGPRTLFGATLDVHSMLGAAALVLIGTQAISFAVFAKVFAITEGLLPMDSRLEKTFRVVTLETGLVLGALLTVAGALLIGRVMSVWSGEQFRTLDYSRTMRSMIPGVLLLVLGAQAILSSFFLSILGLKRR